MPLFSLGCSKKGSHCSILDRPITSGQAMFHLHPRPLLCILFARRLVPLSLALVTLDDIDICIDVRTIDGESGTLGTAGPLFFTNSGRPFFGRMTIDIADIANEANSGLLFDLVLHEMGK